MLKPYMVSDSCPEEGAVLVFAHTTREAKKVGYPAISDWCTDLEWIDVRAVWLKDSPWLFDQADKVKLAADEPHVNDNPIVCSNCEKWGMKLNASGLCENCSEARISNDRTVTTNQT